METMTAYLMSAGRGDMLLAAVNGHLERAGVSITREDASMLQQRRAESLTESERVEFGTPAVVAITEAIADSPHLTQGNAAETLAHLQTSFYTLRGELPVDVPDAEIVDALYGCFNELGDAVEVAALPGDELMAFSRDYMRAITAEDEGIYRIVDDEGHAYTFNPAEWDYDEMASGWDGEEWSDDWSD